jgi:hypothetical protein
MFVFDEINEKIENAEYDDEFFNRVEFSPEIEVSKKREKIINYIIIIGGFLSIIFVILISI